MNKNVLRILVIVTGVITALVHLFLGFRSLGDNLGIPFILNGISYLVLVYAVVAPPAFLAGRGSLMHYLLMGFAALTMFVDRAVIEVRGGYLIIVKCGGRYCSTSPSLWQIRKK